MKKGKPHTIIARKIEVHPNYDEKGERSKVWSYVRDLNYRVRKTANHIVNRQYGVFLDLQRIKNNHPELTTMKARELKFREIYGTSSKNMAYRNAGEMLSETYVKMCLADQVEKLFKSDLSDVLRGNKRLRTYKNGMPIPVSKSGFNELAPIGDTFTFSLTFGKGHRYNFRFNFGRDKSGNKNVIEKIFRGELTFCDMSVMLRDNKMFLNLPVKFPKEKIALDSNIAVGVDLGIATPVCMCLSTYEHIRQSVGTAADFSKQRMKIQLQRRNLQKNLKLTKGGKGRKKKLARLEKLKARERNFVKTMNHKFSKAVIDFALKHNAGVIKMEDLSGIGQDEKNSWVLRNWSYFEQQTMIEYKAERYGIITEKVDPYKTSQKCPCCKKVTEGNRESQSRFSCKNPKCKDHLKEKFADGVAAYNIANTEAGKKRVIPKKKKAKAIA